MIFNKQTINDIDVEDKVVLVRTDYNVPIKNGVITDDLRIRASIPTLRALFKAGAAKVVLISHLGRPDGEIKPELSLKPVAEKLQELIPGFKVFFAPEVSGPEVKMAVENLDEGEVLLLENLRFFPGEEKNNAAFAHEICESVGADVFIQDGFAVVHRAHASTSAITEEVPVAVAGLLLEKEVKTLSELEDPEHPFVVIIGGAKVDDKAPLIERFGSIADQIIVGGKIAADGYTPAAEIADKTYVADSFATNEDGAKLDCSEESVDHMVEILKNAKTVLWNGTLGLTEQPEFAKGSNKLAQVLGTAKDTKVVICGGDTSGFIENYEKDHDDVSYALVSTGGGAALELLSGLDLPGVSSLNDK